MSLNKQVLGKEDLINYFLSGSKKSFLKIGTEHEKFLFNKTSKKPISYKGNISVIKRRKKYFRFN